MTAGTVPAASAVVDVLAGVDDPEYPGVSIVDLGLLEAVRAGEGGGGDVEVDLIPTFLGCPALEFIAADVRTALQHAGFRQPVVRFVDRPVWTPDRITPAARQRLASEFTVAVRGGQSAPACPHCGAMALEETSLFGSMRCRSISKCQACGEQVETIR